MNYVKQIYDESSTSKLKNSALLLVISQVVSFALGLIMFFTGHTDDVLGTYIGLVGDSIYATAFLFLGAAAYNIGMSFPIAQIQADSTRKWIYIFAGMLVLSYIPFVGFLAALVGLIAGIVGLLKLNKLFRIISQSAPQQGKMDSWVIPLYAFYGLISIGLVFITAFIIVITDMPNESIYIAAVIIAGGSLLLGFSLAYILYQNSKKLEYIRQNVDFSQLAQIPAPGIVYQPLQPAKPIQPIEPKRDANFCSSCGSKVLSSDKFCQTCGARINNLSFII